MEINFINKKYFLKKKMGYIYKLLWIDSHIISMCLKI